MKIIEEMKRKKRADIWLVRQDLMGLTQRPEYQAQLSFKFGGPKDWLSDYEDCTWFSHLQDIIEWTYDLTLMDPAKIKDKQTKEWVELLNKLPDHDDKPDLHDCLLFWFAHYSLLGSLPYTGCVLFSNPIADTASPTPSNSPPCNWLPIEHVKHCKELTDEQKAKFSNFKTKTIQGTT
ncbi:MAG: hypothetical protein LBQ98_10850 [Nitrososphaerota archaeon]|jgi:hypothetical protein|nr:hypothetical protein [Nitrososphaerota archaeon]